MRKIWIFLWLQNVAQTPLNTIVLRTKLQKEVLLLFLNRFSFLLDKLTKGLVKKKDQSPYHHQIAQILPSLLLPPSPHLGSSSKGGRTSCWRIPVAGADPQPVYCRWGSHCWHWPGPLQTSQARKVQHWYQLRWWGHWSYPHDPQLVLPQGEGGVDAEELMCMYLAWSKPLHGSTVKI